MNNRDSSLIWEAYNSNNLINEQSGSSVYVIVTEKYYDEGGDVMGVVSSLEGIEDRVVEFARSEPNTGFDTTYDVFEIKLDGPLNYQYDREAIMTIDPKQAGKKEKLYDIRDQDYSTRFGNKDPLPKEPVRITKSGLANKSDISGRKTAIQQRRGEIAQNYEPRRGFPKGQLP